MMEEIKIYSKRIPNKLLHMIYRNVLDMPGNRIDVIDPDNFLQLSMINRPKDFTFKPHIHKEQISNYYRRAQESWVVLSGKVAVSFYDVNEELLGVYELNPFDISITLFGGHAYKILEEGTKVLEYKTGPYTNQEADKRFI